MGRKRNPGLYKRNGIWHIDKKVCKHRICESTGTNDLAEAEKCLAKKIDEVRQASKFGVRSQHSFTEAAIKYLQEHQHKRSIKGDFWRLRNICEKMGELPLAQILSFRF